MCVFLLQIILKSGELWWDLLLVLNTWEDTCGLTQLPDNALNMYAIRFASQSIQANAQWLLCNFMCFFNAPKKLPNHKIHRDVNFHFICLFLMCSKKLPNSEHFPHWRQLWFELTRSTLTVRFTLFHNLTVATPNCDYLKTIIVKNG